MRVQRSSTSSDAPSATKRQPDRNLRRSFFNRCSMSDPTPADPYARRWEALLAENTVIQNEHLELISSIAPPFSKQQTVQLEANAARLEKLSLKLRDLVNEWAAGARPI
jgi:hypothetical protein